MSNLGDRIKSVRESFSCKQADFGKLIGLSSGAMSEVENGKRQPTLEALISICKLAADKGVSLEWLMTGKELHKKNHEVAAEINPAFVRSPLEQYFEAYGDIPEDEPMYERLLQIKKERICPSLYEAIYMAEILQQKEVDVPQAFISLIIAIAESQPRATKINQPPSERRAADILQDKLKKTTLVNSNGTLSERGFEVIVSFLSDNITTLQKLISEE